MGGSGWMELDGWNWVGGSGGSGWVELSEVELKGWKGTK